jgi:hypothetical protein
MNGFLYFVQCLVFQIEHNVSDTGLDSIFRCKGDELATQLAPLDRVDLWHLMMETSSFQIIGKVQERTIVKTLRMVK